MIRAILARLRRSSPGTITVNGVAYSGTEVIVERVAVKIDGAVVSELMLSGSLSIEIQGNAKDVSTASGDIRVQGSVEQIKTASGDVVCGDVKGSVSTASGDVQAKAVHGSVSTMSGDVNVRG